jgi:hypothetical protein
LESGGVTRRTASKGDLASRAILLAVDVTPTAAGVACVSVPPRQEAACPKGGYVAAMLNLSSSAHQDLRLLQARCEEQGEGR